MQRLAASSGWRQALTPTQLELERIELPLPSVKAEDAPLVLVGIGSCASSQDGEVARWRHPKRPCVCSFFHSLCLSVH